MAIRSRGFGTPRCTDRNMAYKFREEIVGKRFLSVSGFTKLKVNKISEWGWRAGVIRAASHRDNGCHDLQVSEKDPSYFYQFLSKVRITKTFRIILDLSVTSMPYIPRSDVTRATSRAAPFVFTSARDLSCVVYPKYARRLSTIIPRIARLTLTETRYCYEKWNSSSTPHNSMINIRQIYGII